MFDSKPIYSFIVFILFCCSRYSYNGLCCISYYKSVSRRRLCRLVLYSCTWVYGDNILYFCTPNNANVIKTLILLSFCQHVALLAFYTKDNIINYNTKRARHILDKYIKKTINKNIQASSKFYAKLLITFKFKF